MLLIVISKVDWKIRRNPKKREALNNIINVIFHKQVLYNGLKGLLSTTFDNTRYSFSAGEFPCGIHWQVKLFEKQK